MEIKEFLKHFENVKKSVDKEQYSARCPGHVDKTNSLSIAPDNNGKILLHCHAGCNTRDVLSAVKLRFADLWPEGPKSNGRARQKIVDVYHYTDELGKELFVSVRYEPKTFRQYRIENGKMCWGIAGVRRVLYRLPELRKDIARGEDIFIVEGEKDVETLRSLGLTATCNPMGAGKWADEYSTMLKGAARITIIADHDDENGNCAGQNHALSVKESLVRAGMSASIVYVPTGKDSSDFVASGGNKEAFLKLASNPPEWQFGNSVPQKKAGRFGKVLDSREGFETIQCEIVLSDNCEYSITVTARQCELNDAIQKAIRSVTGEFYSRWSDSISRRNIKPADMDAIRAIVVVMWYRSRGQFYKNESAGESAGFNSVMYLDRTTGLVERIQSDEFLSKLATRANINRADKLFDITRKLLEDAAMDSRVSRAIEPQAFVAKKNGGIYISNGPSQLVRCKDGVYEVLKNGTDDVVFLSNKTFSPFKLLPDGVEARNPFSTLSQYKNMGYDSSNGCWALEAWFVNIFACHGCRPPLLLCGERNSGKTHLARSLQQLAGYPTDRCSGINPKKEEDFWVSVNDPGLLVFDNLEGEVVQAEWFGSAMESVTTGGGHEARRMYSQERMTYMPNANIIMTSKWPEFAVNDGLADRLVIVRLHAGFDVYQDDVLAREVVDCRDEAMTWAVRTITKALQAKPDIPKNINKRYPDFAEFAIKCAFVNGEYSDMVHALALAEVDKSRIVLEHDPYAKRIYQFLLERKGCWTGSISEMVKGERPDLDSSRLRGETTQFGRCLGRFRLAFDVCFPGWTHSIVHGNAVYVFRGMNTLLIGE